MRVYHIYNDICEASVGEMLSCQRENNNRSNPFAVAIIKSGMIVGHLVRKLGLFSLFLIFAQKWSSDDPNDRWEMVFS